MLRTDPFDLCDRLAVFQTFDRLYLDRNKDVVVGSGGVFSGVLSEDCWGEGRADTPDAGQNTRLKLTTGNWEFREGNERASFFLKKRGVCQRI